MASARAEARQAIEQIVQAVGELVSKPEIEELQINPPQEPEFPWLMLGAAIFKDVLDGLDITGVGVVITTMTSFILALVIFSWIFGKIKWYQRGLLRWALRRFAIVVVIEFIPFIKIIPLWTFYVIFAYHRESKVVKLIYEALGRLQKAGI